MLRLSIVIPALNEERTIGRVIDGCRKYGGDILVVNGPSADNTAQTAIEHGARVIQDNGKGKGAALREAIKQVTGELIVFIDADGSHDPDDIPRLIEPILNGEADHVTGSRLLGGSSELHGGFDEFFRLMGSAFITACINWRYRVRISDSQNGFRAIRTDVARKLALTENITTIEQEMIMKTIKRGFKLVEIPAHEYMRKAGVSKIRLTKVWFRYIYSLVKYLI
ncbi:MAG: glycosyltransferase family 2 protein [Nitrospirae bacterium]|nr:glycosyltransferase family 2 protein [Nitrospirota bacterium]